MYQLNERLLITERLLSQYCITCVPAGHTLGFYAGETEPRAGVSNAHEGIQVVTCIRYMWSQSTPHLC
jgi:hypothetical protein